MKDEVFFANPKATTHLIVSAHSLHLKNVRFRKSTDNPSTVRRNRNVLRGREWDYKR